MRFSISFLSVLSAASAVQAQGLPIFNASDERFGQYQAAGPGDSRGPCPALNALANHGFLPRDGKRIDPIRTVIAAFSGLGVTPETSGFIYAVGLASSKNLMTLTFDLEDLSRHLFAIEHDASFSRNDIRVGNNNDFDFSIWKVALDEINKNDTVTPADMGRAKSARVEAQKILNPQSHYGPRSAGSGAVEAGLIMSALGRATTSAKLEWVRSVFEQERLPTHLGWSPMAGACNVATAGSFGVMALAADPLLGKHLGDVVLNTPGEVFDTMFIPGNNNVQGVNNMFLHMGLDPNSMPVFKGLLQREQQFQQQQQKQK